MTIGGADTAKEDARELLRAVPDLARRLRQRLEACVREEERRQAGREPAESVREERSVVRGWMAKRPGTISTTSDTPSSAHIATWIRAEPSNADDVHEIEEDEARQGESVARVRDRRQPAGKLDRVIGEERPPGRPGPRCRK